MHACQAPTYLVLTCWPPDIRLSTWLKFVDAGAMSLGGGLRGHVYDNGAFVFLLLG
jgi:hypothetical protein